MNDLYHKLFENIDDGFAIIKQIDYLNSRETRYCIVEANEKLIKSLKLDKQNIVGKCIFEIYPEKYDEWNYLFKNISHQNRSKRFITYISSCDSYFLIKAIFLEDSMLALSFVNNESILNEQRNIESIKLRETKEKLQITEQKLMKEDKLANIGQLSAGIAHEINNPLGFVLSNFETLKKYINRFQRTILSYREFKNEILTSNDYGSSGSKQVLSNLEDDNSLDFIMEDLKELFIDTEEGLERVRKIVMALRIFSRQDQEGVFEQYDLNAGIESALLIGKNEIKYTSELEMSLNEIPLIDANAGQINQVLLNIIINASHAIKEKELNGLGLIKIKTYCDENFVYCSIEDNGVGISEENLAKVFNAFYTTKPMGIGTGLGLSISNDIIRNKHKGDIYIESKKDMYTIITIKLPITQEQKGV